ncbi:uncharacterized protein SPAPADRAFT_59381 [Spathaspora passalidarum NRRL Y-27907]|uniref:Uncharacterized protein n=1 Tax=Spathaspora passalidarum (strain NRRL Y-27907 / 11-Y1) TaxID=619300 RepID=G3AJS0_SPAPN|nr:uncharacterized protein SPAPADRAFT_59381 [Spathaspora passalidarum NRRL Y-27907]EGW33971.1 hypothetical protein SPAPADRAFT_59381 [Spathaspora passalidarum NRRL Y-27907]
MTTVAIAQVTIHTVVPIAKAQQPDPIVAHVIGIHAAATVAPAIIIIPAKILSETYFRKLRFSRASAPIVLALIIVLIIYVNDAAMIVNKITMMKTLDSNICTLFIIIL